LSVWHGQTLPTPSITHVGASPYAGCETLFFPPTHLSLTRLTYLEWHGRTQRDAMAWKRL
jgi:hypothetical protein